MPIKLTTLGGILLAIFCAPAAFAATASFAPPTPPPASGMVRDGSSFVFAPAPVRAKAAVTKQQKKLLARVTSDIAKMRVPKTTAPAAAKAPTASVKALAAPTPGAAPAKTPPTPAVPAVSGGTQPGRAKPLRNSPAPPRATRVFSERPPGVTPRAKGQPVRPASHPRLPQGALVVSTRDYNIFDFPAPLRKAILPPGAPVAGKPLYLSGGRVLMLRFVPDGRRPVQLVAELQTRAVVTLTLVPESTVSGRHIPVQAPVPATPALQEYSADPNARFVRYLAKLMTKPEVCPQHVRYWNSAHVRHADHRRPVCWAAPLGGFGPTRLPAERVYNRLRAWPVAAMTNGSTVISAYILTARDGKRSVVDPGQFSWAGVRAALLTGGQVDRYHSPVLYVVTRRGH